MPVLTQTYLKGGLIPGSLEWQLFSDATEYSVALQEILDGSLSTRVFGLATHLTKEGVVESIALACNDTVLVLRAKQNKEHKGKTAKKGSKRTELLQNVLEGRLGRVVGFGIVRLVMYVKQDLGYDVRGFDLLDVLPPKDAVSPGCVARDAFPTSDSFVIDNLWDFQPDDPGNEGKEDEYLCFRAWISARLASHRKWVMALESSASVAAETSRLSLKHFRCIHRMLTEADRMDAAKPRVLENDFSSVDWSEDAHSLVVYNERFKTRVRRSDRTKVVFVDAEGKQHAGRAKGTKGKKTYVQSSRGTSKQDIKQVRVMGREELTNAERSRDKFLLRLLQGSMTLSNPDFLFIRDLWFPKKRMSASSAQITGASIRWGQNGRPLNQSQANVVEAMVVSGDPIVVTHGPPGTGKTTTISVAVKELCSLRRTTWVVAQSNVGVKNIAESLCKHDVDFKLLVSKEFYEEWHEHIYEEVAEHLIRTDELPVNPRDVDLLFSEIRIVLCTLSTLSNPVLTEKRLFALVPVENLVVDEASQIGVFNYLHLFGRFKELKKACFFGDPKQLPPYGQDAAPTLQSIFDIPHLQSAAYFLDTQYRMPVPLGSFISQAVYSSRLLSVHKITTPACVKFVDVYNGEEEKHGKSWKNTREVQTIVHLVRHYYKKQDFCVITPYDAQRSAIQEALKRMNLPWENVFNVDSFQGNEAPYVLVSVVRSTAPGFLRSQNRVNVMLTRCTAGMVVVSRRAFMRHDNVQKTLLGKLVADWEERVGRAGAWCDWKGVAEAKVDLPGAPARKAGSSASKMGSLDMEMEALSLQRYPR